MSTCSRRFALLTVLFACGVLAAPGEASEVRRVGVNLKTARQLGLTPARTVLVRVNRVIE